VEQRKKETKPPFLKNNPQGQPTSREPRMIETRGKRPRKPPIQCWGCGGDHMYRYFPHTGEKVRTHFCARNTVEYVHPSLMHNLHALSQICTTLWNVHTFSLIAILAHSTGAHNTKTWYPSSPSYMYHYIYTYFQWLTSLYGSLHCALLKCMQKSKWLTNLSVQLQMGFGLGTLHSVILISTNNN
jgi:hypothetical protein